MSGTIKKKYFPDLITPEPKRQVAALGWKRNPFTELPPLKAAADDLNNKEVRSILSTPLNFLPPIRRKTPSPAFLSKNDPWPAREKLNPLVFDEKFIDLNLTLSTSESWTEEVCSNCM